MTVSSLQWVLCSLCLFFYWVILGPSQVFFWYELYRVRSDPIIRKRYFELVMIANAALTLFTFVEKPFYYLGAIYGTQRGHFEEAHNNFGIICQRISDIAYILESHGFAAALLLRAWLLYFDTKWSLATQREQWVQHINDSIVKKHNWFINHRSTFGNVRWMAKYAFLPYFIIAAILNTILSLVAVKIHYLVDNGLYGSLLTVFITLLLLIPEFTDFYLVRREMILLTMLASSCLGIYIVQTSLFYANYPFFPIFAIVQPIYAILQWLIAMTTTYWLLYQSRLQWTIIRPITLTIPFCNHRYSLSNVSSAMSQQSTTGRLVTEDSGTRKRTNTKSEIGAMRSLENTLAKSETFELFMQHLIREFSSENLLAIVEMTQFQIKARDSLASANTDDNALPSIIVLPSDIPQSTIVGNTQLSIAEKFAGLAEKYIINTAEFEVNISYVIRCDVMEIYQNRMSGDVSDGTIIQSFDNVLKELLSLLRHCHTRFMRKNQISVV